MSAWFRPLGIIEVVSFSRFAICFFVELAARSAGEGEDEFLGGFAAHDAEADAAVLERELRGFKAHAQAVVGIQDVVEDLLLRQFRADLGERGSEVRAFAADAVAGDAGAFRALENGAALLDVAFHFHQLGNRWERLSAERSGRGEQLVDVFFEVEIILIFVLVDFPFARHLLNELSCHLEFLRFDFYFFSFLVELFNFFWSFYNLK